MQPLRKEASHQGIAVCCDEKRWRLQDVQSPASSLPCCEREQTVAWCATATCRLQPLAQRLAAAAEGESSAPQMAEGARRSDGDFYTAMIGHTSHAHRLCALWARQLQRPAAAQPTIPFLRRTSQRPATSHGIDFVRSSPLAHPLFSPLAQRPFTLRLHTSLSECRLQLPLLSRADAQSIMASTQPSRPTIRGLLSSYHPPLPECAVAAAAAAAPGVLN